MTGALCVDPEGAMPCRYWERCHESRRRLQHDLGLRGERCWAFTMHNQRAPIDLERAAIAAEDRPLAGQPSEGP